MHLGKDYKNAKNPSGEKDDAKLKLTGVGLGSSDAHENTHTPHQSAWLQVLPPPIPLGFQFLESGP